jgi:hypothetical protein
MEPRNNLFPLKNSKKYISKNFAILILIGACPAQPIKNGATQLDHHQHCWISPTPVPIAGYMLSTPLLLLIKKRLAPAKISLIFTKLWQAISLLTGVLSKNGKSKK